MMRYALGVMSLALAMIAIFVPQNGLYISGVALLVAGAAAFYSDKGFALATPICVAGNLFFLNPNYVTMINKSRDVLMLWFLIVVFLAIPLVAAALSASGAFDFSERAKHH